MEKRAFGESSKGEKATLYTFENENGMRMSVTDFGATLQAVMVPDKDGILRDVVLGHDDAEGYEKGKGCLGATVGRNANRIGKAAFSMNGKQYTLDKNNNQNNLHSGFDFYFFRVWKVTESTKNSITFSLHSPDGDQGFPGALDVSVTYTLTDDNGVRLDYHGVPTEDTIVNMTNHSYFNLAGHASGTILDQKVWLDADAYTRADSESIPTGEITPVEGTPMDFRQPKTIGRDIGMDYEALVFGQGYDHNWALNNHGSYAKVAELSAASTGITMEVYTDLPGIQMYTGNFLVREPGKDGAFYLKNQGVCFETQYFPDAINHANFASPICKGGETYQTTTFYKFITIL